MSSRIALINSWPNLTASAEAEFIKRFGACCEKIGYEHTVCITSTDLIESGSHFALPLHEFTPKLTGIPTLGPMWSPPEFYRSDDDRIRAIMSYDGYLTGSNIVTQFLDNLWFSTATSKPISPFHFLPTSARSEIMTSCFSRMFYAGVHWDGKRHGDLLSRLSQSDSIDIYGPASSWTHVPESYRGELPFDGRSLFSALSRSGIALALHSDAHVRANTPSMRLFEAASVGCAIIADNMPFIKDVFGDTVYLVTATDPEQRCEQIQGFVDEIQTVPSLALDRAQAARNIFEKNWSLEVLIPQIFDFAEIVREQEGYNRARPSVKPESDQPKVSVCIRTGGRELKYLKRALKSVSDQTYPCIEVIVVDYAHRSDVEEAVSVFARDFRNANRSVRYVKGRQTGLRSTAIFDGIAASSGEFFSLLDDDDELYPNNFHVLVRAAIEANSPFVYGGVIKHMEDGPTFTAPNHLGPGTVIVEERRDLHFFDPFNRERLKMFDNFIQSNTWIMNKGILSSVTRMDDPCLVVAEDVYLYRLMMEVQDPAFTFRVAAQWNWRTGSGENSMTLVHQNVWAESGLDAFLRLKFLDKGITFKRSTAFSMVEPNADYLLSKGDIAPVRRNFITQCRPTGFSREVEQEGIWTTSEKASFQVDLDIASASILSLKLDVSAHESLGVQSVSVYLDGSLVYSQPFASWTSTTIEFPVQSKQTRTYEVKFICSYTLCPAELGNSGDTRNLGLFLREMRLLDSSSVDSDLPDEAVAVSKETLETSEPLKAPALHVETVLEGAGVGPNPGSRSEHHKDEDEYSRAKGTDTDDFGVAIRELSWR